MGYLIISSAILLGGWFLWVAWQGRRWARWAIRAVEFGTDRVQNAAVSPSDRKQRYDQWHTSIADKCTRYCFATDAGRIRRLRSVTPRGFNGANQLDADVKEWTAEMCVRLNDLADRVESGRTFLKRWWWVPAQPDLD